MSDHIELRLAELEKKVSEHREVLGGGINEDQPGLMHLMRQLWKDMYDDKHGLKPRVDKWEWWARGAYAVVAIIIALLILIWTHKDSLKH